ncbi:MAG TPA: exodeoxyribonuclease VII small subunit [Tepidisphaeraceae bacterium]|nr:exodeoxyribonuclease VII small subunit [Tepidisphaeraceae bacterium]
MAKPHPPPTFEKALHELEEIVVEIETGQLSLEENLARYERGRFLVQHCQEVLDQAQQRIDRSTPASELPASSEVDQAGKPEA